MKRFGIGLGIGAVVLALFAFLGEGFLVQVKVGVRNPIGKKGEVLMFGGSANFFHSVPTEPGIVQ